MSKVRDLETRLMAEKLTDFQEAMKEETPLTSSRAARHAGKAGFSKVNNPYLLRLTFNS